MDHMLAIVKITRISAKEVRYIQSEICDSNVTCDRKVLNSDEESGEVSFAIVIDERDYARCYIDDWVVARLHQMVNLFRTYTRVDKDATVPFTRHFAFLISPEASMPINYTIEYRTYDREYITDDILEELKNEQKR